MAIILAAFTVLATALGGLLALRAKDRFHLVLGLSAGLLLGLVGFDLLPEVFHESTESGGVPTVSIAILSGFLMLHILERRFGGHEPVDSEYSHDHSHGSIAGGIGALAMAVHVFLDGAALGLAFKVSTELGVAVFIALLVHAFSDGLNTVSMLVKSGNWQTKSKLLLVVDGVARISGATLGTYLTLEGNFVVIYLALFSGMIIYLATSHILPEAHSHHPSRWTFAATGAGILAMWAIVGTLGH
ncbi:MAG: ZIP family metal transporter [Candidatus Nanopelagicaceae bacterium]